MSADSQHEFLVATDVTKRYGSVVALRDASLRCRLGEIHAVFGENGAGKSTLLKVLGGTVSPNSGTATVQGQPHRLGDARAARRAGITAVYQELSIIPDLTVAENVFLLREPTRRLGLVNRRILRRRTQQLFNELGITGLRPGARAAQLSLAEKQIVEIAKAATQDASLIILDEPTSALSQAESAWLLDLMRRWRDEGRCVIFVSHRYAEIKAIADRISIYRDGEFVGCYGQGELSDEAIVEKMCGRPVEMLFPERTPVAPDAPEALRAEELEPRRAGRKLSFAARQGEILGVAGLAGQGQLALFLSLFGALSHRGHVFVGGKLVKLRRPADAVRAGMGIALVPAERKTEGLLLTRSTRENMSLAALRLLSTWGLIRRSLEERRVEQVVRELNIVVGDVNAPVRRLSGGNQQKVLIGKWILAGAKILLLFDITRGVDVATKAQIYKMISEFAVDGGTVLLYSTDTREIASLCHRSLVLHEAQIIEVLEGEDLEERSLVGAALKGRAAAEPSLVHGATQA